MLPAALQSSDNPAIEPVSITIEQHGGGWILFTVSLDKQQRQTHFSDVFDPMPELKRWLEAIAIGVEQCSFSYDPDGRYVRMSYCRMKPGKGVFCMGSDDGWNDEIYLSAYVDPRHLVKCFYSTFRDLFDSPDFLKNKWEAYYVWENLVKVFHTDYDQLLTVLVSLPRWEPAMILSFDLPELGMPIPEIINRGAEWKQFIKQLQTNYLATKEEYDRNHWVRAANLIPRDYDRWSRSKKTALVEHELNIPYAEHGSGEKIAAFRSEMIEAFIAGEGG